MQDSYKNHVQYNEFYRFVAFDCPHPAHYCNGQHVPDIKLSDGTDKIKTKDVGVCQYYKDGRCTHPHNPKIRKIRIKKVRAAV